MPSGSRLYFNSMSGTPRARFRARKRVFRALGTRRRTALGSKAFVARVVRQQNETKCSVFPVGALQLLDISNDASIGNQWFLPASQIVVGAANSQRIGNRIFVLNLNIVGGLRFAGTTPTAGFVRCCVFYTPTQLPPGAMPLPERAVDFTLYPQLMKLWDKKFFVTASVTSACGNGDVGPVFNINKLIRVHKTVEFSGAATTKGFLYVGWISNLAPNGSADTVNPVWNGTYRLLFKDP